MRRFFLTWSGKGQERTQQAVMYSEIEPKRSGVVGVVFAIIVIALMCYLTFAALQGEHGLFSLFQTEVQESRLAAELAQLQAERATISNKTLRLSTAHIDPDLLDQQARKVLGFGRPDEIIVR